MNLPVEVLDLPEHLASRVRREAEQSYPREACGFLLGERRGAQARVRRLMAATNRAERADRFLIAARDVFAAMKHARGAGDTLLGVYHSHPGAGPRPSAVDRAEAWYEWLYLIVSVPAMLPPAPLMACWFWDGETFQSIRLCSELGDGGRSEPIEGAPQ